MNKRQVTILWVIAIALGAAVAVVKLSQNQSAHSATKRVQGQTLFESFPATAAAAIEIKGAAGTVTLARKDGKWVVRERNDYPANGTFVNDFIRTLSELKVTLGMEAGPSFAPRFGMDETAATPEDRGLTASFKDADGKEIARVSLGKSIGSSSGLSPMGGAVGRYVRNHADESGFYAVSEMFPSVSDEPKRWLADGFINPEKIKSIVVSQPDKKDPAWKLIRDNEESEYKLEGATPTEVLNTTVTSPLKSLFSYARFEDIVPADKVAGRAESDGKRTATIETFEGFTYTVNLTPTKPNNTPPAPLSPGMEPPATDNFLVTVEVAAELPKERKKEEGEKPEDAKAKDAAFTERHKTLSEKLVKEKALAGITFEVAKSTVGPLLNDRAALITKATPPAAGGPSGAIQNLPGGMIARPPVTATTPPIAVPGEKEEGIEEIEDESEEE